MDYSKKIYEAASSNDTNQLNNLLEHEIHINYPLDDVLQKVCMELQLNCVYLSEDTKITLERKLLNLRFFCKQSKTHLSSQDIKDRIEFVLELIHNLHIFDDNNELFVENLAFIAKQIFILKKLMKSTYDRLPWEEIEFCVLSYIRGFKEKDENALFSRAILGRSDIVGYLRSFANCLENLQEYVLKVKPQELSKVPNSKRDEIVDEIIGKYPEFKTLYIDYERIRDIHSLNIMLKYVELVETSEVDEEHNIWVLIRALQVLGEHLKNTLETPKLSDTTTRFLMAYFSEETRKIVINLRNTLSHSQSMKESLFESFDSNFINGIKNDIKKIGAQINYILIKYKIKILRELCDKFMNTDDENVMKEVSLVVKNFGDGSFSFKNICELNNNDMSKLKGLIDQYRRKISIEGEHIELYFQTIDEILREHPKSRPKDYVVALYSIQTLFEQFYVSSEKSFNHTNHIRTTKYWINQVSKNLSPQIESSEFNMITDIIASIHSLLSEQSEDGEVERLFLEIMHMAKFEVNNVTWADKFRRKLRNKDNYLETPKNEKVEKVSKKQIHKKLNLLRKIFTDMTYTGFKKNNALQAVVEILLLDLIPLLKNVNSKSEVFLDQGYPTLLGLELRNHLAHNNVMIEVLLDSTAAIYLFVEKLLEVDTETQSSNLKNIRFSDISSMKKTYCTIVEVLNRKHKMFAALKDNNFEAFLQCINEGADFRSRDIDMSSCLHFAMHKPDTVDITKFLWKRGLRCNSNNLKGQSPLHIAVTKENLEVVEFLLKNLDCNVNDVGSFDRTAAHLAALNGNEHMLNTLINHGADMSLKDKSFFTPLQCAVLSGKISAVEIFFKRNLFDKLVEIPGGLTVLHIASEEGSINMVEYLLSVNVKVDSRTDRGATALHTAAFSGHLDVVRSLIRAGADVNCSNINGSCALHRACEAGHDEIVEVLIRNGADVNVANHEDRFAPIHYAAADGHFNIVKILLENNAKFNLSTEYGRTPLFEAVKGHHLKIVELLLKQGGINVNTVDLTGNTPLHEAAAHNDTEIVKLLIQNGARVDFRNPAGLTPLHLAAKYGDEDTVGLLINNTDSINIETMAKELPLHFAAESGNEKVIKKLINEGTDINATTAIGANCLHIAIKNNRNILDLLIQEGIKVNVQTKDSGFTPLHKAVLQNNLEMVKTLLEAGSYINTQDYLGNTPIHLAIEGNSKEIFLFLLENGADIRLENKTRNVPLLTAVVKNRAKFVEILMASGPVETGLTIKALLRAIFDGNTNLVKLILGLNPNLYSSKCSDAEELLHVAAMLGRVDIVELLLKSGASVDSKNRFDHFPLSYAANKGFDEIVEILLKKGAQINVQDQEGATPLHIVSTQHNKKLVEILLSHGADVNKLDKKNRLPIELAVSSGDLDTVKVLFERNKSVLNRKGNDNFTLLHIAAQKGCSETIKFLLDEGADMHSVNINGSMPIHIAAREGFTDIIDIFIENGMDLDIRGCNNNSLLHYAASNGKVEVLKYLLKCGCDINARNASGSSALKTAAVQGHKDAVYYLLNNGSFCDIDQEHIPNNRIEIHQMLSSVKKLFACIHDGNIVEIEKIIREGIPLNSVDSRKGSALHFAVYKERFDVVEILLQNKISTNIKHKNGWTPLHYAVKYSLDKMVFLLLSNGARYDVEADNGKKPIDFAQNGSIRNLLQLINESFESIQKKNSNIVSRLKKIKDEEVIKAIMRTVNKNGTTLITAAILNKFPNVHQLEEIFQTNVPQLKEIDNLIAEEKYLEAQEKLTLIHERRRNILGDDNPATLSIKSLMVKMLYKQHQYQLASISSKEICKKLETCLGVDHERTLNERSGLALILHRLGENEESLRIFEEVHEMQKKIIPPSHTDYLNTIKHMALTLMSLEKLERALKFNKIALDIEEKKFGAWHPTTLVSKNNIALILHQQKQYDEALKYFQEVYEIRKLTLGPYHSDTLRSLHNKITVYRSQEKYNEASEAYEKLLKTQKEHLGLHHLDTLDTQYEMANLLLEQGKFVGAFKIFKEIINHMEALQGPNHMQVIQIKSRMETILEHFRNLGITDNLDRLLETLVSTINNASRTGDVGTIEKLVKSGVDVREKDNDGRSSLHFAVDGQNIEVIKLLLRYGADITEKTNKGNTALHTACSKGYKEAVELLLSSVDLKDLNYLVNATTNTGKMTALHVAAEKGFPDIVQLLLQKGAIYNCVNRTGKKPLDLTKDERVKNILSITDENFAALEKKNFSKIPELYKIGNNDFLCVTGAKNSQNNTLVSLLISYGQTDLARQLLVMMKKEKNNCE